MMSIDVSQMSGVQLCQRGWTRRFSALGRRLDEAIELYSQLGYEVLLTTVDLDDEELPGAEGCENCFVISHARTIYTRPVEQPERK